MKKLKLLFSLLCMAVAFWHSPAWAQTGTFPRQYVQGDNVTEIVDGMEVVFTPNAGDYNGGEFFGAVLHPDDKDSPVSSLFEAEPSENSIFVIEGAGEFTDEYGSYAAYRIKNKATGYYFAAQHLFQEGDAGMKWTTDPGKAFICTILKTESTTDEEGANPRASTAPEGNNANSIPDIGNSWIIADTDKQYDSMGEDGNPLKALYFCCWLPGLSQYSDTNQWYICDFEETKEYRDALSRIIFDLYDSAENIQAMFPVGTAPGDYSDAAAVQTLIELFNEFEAWSGEEGMAQYEECAEIYARFVAARAAVDASEVKFQAGHYYAFSSVKTKDAYPFVRSEITSAGSIIGADVHPFPEEITAEEAKYIWQLEDAGDGYFYIRNYTTGKYPVWPGSGKIGQVSDEPVDGAIYTIKVSGYKEERCFNIVPKSDSGKGWNIANTGVGGICAWGSLSTDKGSNWRVLEISEETIKGLESQVAQKELNDRLAVLYPKASALFNKGRVYTTDEAANDGVFSVPADGFVTDASQLWSNAPEKSEGPIEDLLDGNFQTFFHSAWQNVPAGIKYHTLEADLGSEQQVIALKYARRLRTLTGTQDGPATFNFYATNDTTTATGKWDYIGAYEFVYNQSAMAPASEKAEDAENIVEYPNASGIMGMDMKAPYRYIRIEVTGSLRPDNSKAFFNLSEFRVYTGRYDADASTSYNKVPAEIRNAFESALDAATPQFLNQTATQEVIDNLQAAFDAFQAEYPDENRVLDAVSGAKAEIAAYSNAGVIGEGIGMYPAEAKDNFDATMTTIEEAVNNNMSVEEINRLVAQAKQAVADFLAALRLPEAGKIYALRGLSTEKMRHDAIVTDYSNDYNTYLTYTVDTVSNERVDLYSALNYLWKVEKSSLEEGIVLRNLATGFYMDTTVVLNRGLRTVSEPVALGIQTAKVPHGFNIIVGKNQANNETLYANYAGGRVAFVSWNTASGTDNSCISFEEVPLSEDPAEYNVNWPITAGKPNILTLPFSIFYGDDENGNKGYTVLGEKATVEGEETVYSLELKEIKDGTEIPAGTPFIVIGVNEETPYFRMSLMEANAYDIPYAKEAVDGGNDLIVGTISGLQLDWNQVGFMTFRNGNVYFITTEQEELTRIGGNSGYIKAGSTEETGDVSLILRRSIASGIEDAVIADKNAMVDVYTISGVQVRKAVKAAVATNGLPAGLYIVGGKKVLVK